MTDRPEGAGTSAAAGAGAGAGAEARRRRRERVFGDVLPESTTDDREPDGEGRAGSAAERRTGETASDEWLRANVPPHHG